MTTRLMLLAALGTDQRRLYLILFLAPFFLAAGCLYFTRLFTSTAPTEVKMTTTPLTYDGLGDTTIEAPEAPARVARTVRVRLAYALSPTSTLPVYIGVGLCAFGFVVLGLGWLYVAQLGDVWKQMPYVLSAGFPGIGLIMVGLVTVNVAIRRQEAEATRRQLAELTDAIRTSRQRGRR